MTVYFYESGYWKMYTSQFMRLIQDTIYMYRFAREVQVMQYVDRKRFVKDNILVGPKKRKKI